MKTRLWHWSLGSVTGAVVAAGLFALVWAARGDLASLSSNPEPFLLVVVAGALASGLAALVISTRARRPIVQVVQQVVAAPAPPVATPEPVPAPLEDKPAPAPKPRRRQAPFLSRLHVGRLSPELRWEKVSRSLQKLFATSGKKLRGTSILERIHEEDRIVIERRFHSPSRIGFDARFRILPPARKSKKDSKLEPLHVQLTAAPGRDAAGKFQGWRVVFVDLTRQVQSEQARQTHAAELAQAQEKQRRIRQQLDRLKESYFDLYHHAPVMYFSLDAEGKFVTCNATLLRTMGLEREQLLGRKYVDILATKTSNTPVSFELPSDKQEEWETQWKKPDGAVVDVWLRTVAVFDEDGKFVRWRSSALDLTERNRLANQLRAHTDELERTNARLRHINGELEGFSHVVSHDLKEPLRTLQAYSHLLAEDFSSQLSTDGFQYVNHLLQASRRLGHLIDDLLNLSQAGRAARAPRAFPLNEVVATVRRDLVHLIQRKEASILTDGPLPTIVGDAQRITQLLTNLVANGLKYNKSAAPQVVIGQTTNGADERHAVLYVRDNGIGIDPKHHEQIFGLFRRVSHNDQYEGTGAGLAICKKIVESHGGRLWVESQVGQGATFYFSLPRVPAQAATRTSKAGRTEDKSKARRERQPDSGGKHLLVVEDNAELGAVIQKLGKRSGLEITWFPSAEHAWEWLQKGRPDFMLFDINLPGMNGLELCRRVRTELQLDTPIAMFSHEHQSDELAKFRELGADYFLSKDLLADPTVWQQRLHELMTARKSPAQAAS